MIDKKWLGHELPASVLPLQVAAADFYGSGKNQIGVFYDAGKHNAALYVFDDAFALEKIWEQPAGWFDWPSSRLFVADLRGQPVMTRPTQKRGQRPGVQPIREVRGGSQHRLTVGDLLKLRALVERSASCPHGRPTSIRLTIRELEKRFGRT